MLFIIRIAAPRCKLLINIIKVYALKKEVKNRQKPNISNPHLLIKIVVDMKMIVEYSLVLK